MGSEMCIRDRAYKAEVVNAAQGEASRFESLLTQYEKAPEVTRERLYIESLESVLSSSSKVMVDVEGGNNLMYLPLDKLMGGGSGGGTANIIEEIKKGGQQFNSSQTPNSQGLGNNGSNQSRSRSREAR